jgi:hypothetical protein
MNLVRLLKSTCPNPGFLASMFGTQIPNRRKTMASPESSESHMPTAIVVEPPCHFRQYE